jgi:predicted permease
MAQGTARQHEIAMRAALGASGGDIVRHLITESMLLAAIGLPAGVLASHGILAAIQMVLPPYAFAPEVVIRIHLPVLAFSALLSLLTAVVFGLWPALQLSWTEAGRAVATASRRVAGSIRGRRTHGALICAQIALTLVLVATAGASGQAFVQLMQTPLGYDPHNVMSVGIPIRENSYTTWEARTAYFDQLRAKVAETPGVTMTAISSNGTPPRSGWMTPFEILGAPAVEQQKASANFVSSEYFEMLRIPMVEGRIWSKGEERQGTHVAVVNQTFARRYFPNGGATGRSIKMPQMDDGQALTAGNVKDSWLQVIGVVSDARNDGLSKPVAPGVYVPYTLVLWRGTQVLVKAETSPLSLLRAVRMQLTTVDPEQQSHSGSEDLETWIRNQMEWRQGYLVMSIFAGFGILGLALAAVGLYSVVSYTVVQRTNEFAVRMALGAAPGHVLRIVLSSTVGSVGAGVFIGLLLTRGLSALLAQWARGNSGDPWILLAGAMVLSMVAAAASALPAWRASRVDPMTALRCE